MLKFHRKLPFSKEKKCCLTSSANTLPNSRENPELQRILFEPPKFFFPIATTSHSKKGGHYRPFLVCVFSILCFAPPKPKFWTTNTCALRGGLWELLSSLLKNYTRPFGCSLGINYMAPANTRPADSSGWQLRSVFHGQTNRYLYCNLSAGLRGRVRLRVQKKRYCPLLNYYHSVN